MDKLEYIPGDLVKFATNTYTIVNFEENFLHNKICYGLISNNSTKTAFVADRDILPIPITSYILEKNGWKKDDRGYNFRDIIFLNKDDFGGWSVGIGEDYILTIASIHQLQHLLFGLGLNSEMEV